MPLSFNDPALAGHYKLDNWVWECVRPEPDGTNG
jgi:hypothetical protein